MVRFLILIFSLASPIWATSKLISVVQVFRHGQRTPVSHYPNDPYDDLAYWGIGPGQLTNVSMTSRKYLHPYYVCGSS
ncbi:hypothetical protein JTB14_019623 [Gonioctena quinquepunctata]|nr:hypothetical protein JTB14_019623 [Gonioctena quinquepunctata]